MFKLAQTFYVDPSAFANAPEVGITRVDLFFRAKPPEVNNASGIQGPGVEVAIVPCINGVPAINELGIIRPTEPTEHGSRFAFYSGGLTARREWGEIQASEDGNTATTFKFQIPYFIKTDQEYAILIKYDGSDQYKLWQAKAGEQIIGTNTVFTTPPKSIGNLYEYISPTKFPVDLIPSTSSDPNSLLNNTTTKNSTQSITTGGHDPNYLQTLWKPLASTDIKFSVYFARYFVNGVPVSSNTELYNDPTRTTSKDVPSKGTIPPIWNEGSKKWTLVSQGPRHEYITYENKNSKVDKAYYGELVYQVQPFYPGAGSANNSGGAAAVCTVAVSNSINDRLVVANGSYIYSNGSTFNSVGGWNALYTGRRRDSIREFIVIQSGNTVAVRRVVEVISNTVLIVDEGIPFSNAAAYFYKSPTGVLKSLGKHHIFKKSANFLHLTKSNANAQTRFVNNTILEIKVDNGGTGYSNSDYIRVSGFESVANKVVGGYPAFANVITNANGTITKVMITNTGCGFVEKKWLRRHSGILNANVRVLNSSSSNSTGTGAKFDFDIGATLKSEFNSNNSFSECKIVNLPIHRGRPEITINNPLGTVFNLKLQHMFHMLKDNNVWGGWVYHILRKEDREDTELKIFNSHRFNFKWKYVLVSRSNMFITPFANGTIPTTDDIGEEESNGAIITIDVVANNDYIVPHVEPEVIKMHYAKYLINNDATNEHTNYGNATAKHITTKVNFAEGRFAEDLIVYTTAHRPANTDILVYARVHNSNDPEAFDDKDWTLMECVGNNQVFANKDNSSDYYEYEYSFKSHPDKDSTLGGTVAVYQGYNYVNGQGTTFTNSNIYNIVRSNLVNSSADFIQTGFTYYVEDDALDVYEQKFANTNQVKYRTRTGVTPITGLTNNALYYVVEANSSGVKLSSTKNGTAVNITAVNTAFTFNSNSDVFNTEDFIAIASNPFEVGDQLKYLVSTGNTAISGLTNNTDYFVVFSNSTGVALSDNPFGANINISNNGLNETGHTLTTGSGHYLYRTALLPDDLVKIYSPLFPNNYTIEVVDYVANDTQFYIKSSLGDLQANLVGTVSVNATSSNINGTSTLFNIDFAANDFVAVWSNASAYEVRKITSVTNSTQIVIDSPLTIVNAAANYTIVEPSAFTNNAITTNGLKVDRLKLNRQAFNYMPNQNVVRYYNSGMVKFDTFDTFQLKFVLLSDDEIIVPKIDDIRSVGVSA